MGAHRKQEERRPGFDVQLHPHPSRETQADFGPGGGFPDPVHDVLQLVEVVKEGQDLGEEPVRVDVDDGRHLELEGGVVRPLKTRQVSFLSFFCQKTLLGFTSEVSHFRSTKMGTTDF